MVHLELLVTAGSANDSLHEGLSDKVLYWALLLGVGNARKLLDPLITGNRDGETVIQELVF